MQIGHPAAKAQSPPHKSLLIPVYMDVLRDLGILINLVQRCTLNDNATHIANARYRAIPA